MMTANEIRQKFLDFFKEKGHLIVSSAPLVAKNDPTLMFNNSGMAQFKDFFLGNGVPPSKRIADTQKCLRVTGKHNDLEDVGHDTYHHTMFEMLGNWSFGDYFKKEAIAWSWELLTEVYKLPKDRLYATVFEGDAKENLEPDTEALELWKQYLPESQILFGNKKDNFWEMGETGPCGPCSEIHIDLRDDEEIAKISGRDLVNQDNPLVIEIWNNVFMQFERKADKSLVLLPAQHVDTGMGFERLCMAIQGKKSNYDTDIFQPLIQFIANESPLTPKGEASGLVALRVIADHIRAVSFAISDGLLPANNKAGYVIRRILRRAVRYGYSYLGFREPFMHKLVPILAEQFKDVFPELIQQKDFVVNVIREEENSFLNTIYSGMLVFNTNLRHQLKSQLISFLQENNIEAILNENENSFNEIDLPTLNKHIQIDIQDNNLTSIGHPYYDYPNNNNSIVIINGKEVTKIDFSEALNIPDLNTKFFKFNEKLEGKTAFIMYDRNGFPVDLTQLLTKEINWGVDMEEFNRLMKIQSDGGNVKKETSDWVEVNPISDKVEFVGYDQFECEAQIVKYRRISQNDKVFYQIVLDKTPFYAESGGQVGDSGHLTFINKYFTLAKEELVKINITDTKKENDLIIHITEDNIEEMIQRHLISHSIVWRAFVDKSRRNLITSNHSATHLMHSALREVLGNHVAQKGQLVNEKALRFDFSHFAKISEEDLSKIENIVNQKIRESIALDERRNVPINQAVEELKATALFGEKYGDFVRVITFDENFSRELCGGTHVKNTAEIGMFKIMAESSSSAGVRRIEAITSETAFAYIQEQLTLIEELKEILKNPQDLKKSVLDLIETNRNLEKQIEVFENQQVQNLKNELTSKIENRDGMNFLATQVKVPSADALKQLAFDLKAKVENLFLVLAAEIEGKPQIAVMISDNLVKEKGLHAGNIVKELAKEIQGGGGGQPFFATAGGKDVSGLERVLEKAKSLI